MPMSYVALIKFDKITIVFKLRTYIEQTFPQVQNLCKLLLVSSVCLHRSLSGCHTIETRSRKMELKIVKSPISAFT